MDENFCAKTPFSLIIKVSFLFTFLFTTHFSFAQDSSMPEKEMMEDEMMEKEPVEEKVVQTFRHTRVINSHSVETLPARKLDFRITHRFGDIAGSGGGWPTFYGLENATDVGIGFEYGVTDNFMIGINRTKGAGPLKQLVNGLAKVRVMNQEKNGNLPFSLAVVGVLTGSTMQKSLSPEALNFFENRSHRYSYHLGFHAARKFSDAFSLQFNAAWTFRNIVDFGDQNDLPSVGGSLRWNMSKALGIILDATFPLDSDYRTSENGFYPIYGIGFEFDTSGGHVFQLNFTNAAGLNETDYIPYSTSDWSEGQFRMGFTISRLFSL